MQQLTIKYLNYSFIVNFYFFRKLEIIITLQRPQQLILLFEI